MFERIRNKFRKRNEIGKQDIYTAKEEADQLSEAEIHEHQKHYSSSDLWEKVQNVAKKAGSNVIYAVLLLYYTLQNRDIPKRLKMTIYGALGYFILPFDLIPDWLVGVGYVDDLSVLVYAIGQLVQYIDEDIKIMAKQKLTTWFGEDVDTKLVDDNL
ncbi:hypothetical protein CEY16_07860 [Halalkalibacillus sediminis]|uniref:DUF1232 domain-containing protein n=1 Tax=Halalkalibacillus sediminis TaxID=2018042 RepID=A0A2I0QU10_9BACI|nr:DUF1232 domain-containing protein [Halalkalibacillus sediminis]PKR77835.1 hypothetical protein CEY16_07860 [Halalkalibacillus sediminis]